MSDWRADVREVLGVDGRFIGLLKSETRETPPHETRMNTGAEIAPEVYQVYKVSNPPLREKPISNKIQLILEKNRGHINPQSAIYEDFQERTQEAPDKPNKPQKEVNKVSEVYRVPESRQIARSIVVAVKTGDPALIAAAVAENPDLGERAAIYEYDAGLCRLDAEITALHDALDEAGYVL